MELMHNCFSKLEIETHHPHSSSKEKEEEEEDVNRNWAELPEDVLNVIFLKLDTFDILVSAQWVCTSWWKLSKQPHLFRFIHVKPIFTLFGRCVYSIRKLSSGLAKEAIDRSCGQLVEFSVGDIATDELLHYMSEKSSSLRCLRVGNYRAVVTEHGLKQTAKKLPLLEELEIVQRLYFSKHVLRTFGCFCPRLKSCRLKNKVEFFGNDFHEKVVLPIAENMPELRHLKLMRTSLTDYNLRAILDGCPHLDSLDLRDCLNLNFTGDMLERCRNIQVFRPPK